MPFDPRYEILPESQQKLWPDLAPVKDLGFTLYGGTALALRRGHRTSVDFDFFSDRPLDREALSRALPLLNEPGVEVLQESPNTFVALVPPNADRPAITPAGADEFGDGRVKVSFFGDLDIGRVGAPELTQDGVLLVASPRDLMATKLKALFDRVELKDYVDIHELVQHGQSLAQGLRDAAALWPGFPPDHCLAALGYHASPELRDLNPAQRAVLNAKIGAAENELAQSGFAATPKKAQRLGLTGPAMEREQQATATPRTEPDGPIR